MYFLKKLRWRELVLMNTFCVLCNIFRLVVTGLTLEESTDIPTLQRELNKVDQQIKQLSTSKRSKFTERQHKEELKVIYYRW